MTLANKDGASTDPQEEDAEFHWPPKSAHLITVFAYANRCMIIIDVGGGGEDSAGGGTYIVVGGGTYVVVGGGTYSVVGGGTYIVVGGGKYVVVGGGKYVGYGVAEPGGGV